MKLRFDMTDCAKSGQRFFPEVRGHQNLSVYDLPINLTSNLLEAVMRRIPGRFDTKAFTSTGGDLSNARIIELESPLLVTKLHLRIEASFIVPLFLSNGASIQAPNMTGFLIRSLVGGDIEKCPLSSEERAR